MATITFRTKPIAVYNCGIPATVAYRLIKVPELKRAHCDMGAFRSHPRYGAFANSDLFPSVLARIRRDTANVYGEIKIGSEPENVTVVQEKFMVMVTINV